MIEIDASNECKMLFEETGVHIDTPYAGKIIAIQLASLLLRTAYKNLNI